MNISKNKRISTERNTDSLLSYSKDMLITDPLQELTGPDTNGEKDLEIDLVCDTTWLIQNS